MLGVRIERSWSRPRGIESMVGGTSRSSPQLIQNGWLIVVLVPPRSANIAMLRHCQGDFLVDIPFALIEGHRTMILRDENRL